MLAVTRGYTVKLDPAAQRAFRKLPREEQPTVMEKILSLERNPRPPGNDLIARDKDGPIHRVRSGAYRIIYTIRSRKVVVIVLLIGHRREVYSVLDRLLRRR